MYHRVSGVNDVDWGVLAPHVAVTLGENITFEMVDGLESPVLSWQGQDYVLQLIQTPR